jgi:ABC-type dipeptide/oligopeptide/nickel transport system ATPase subunit
MNGPLLEVDGLTVLLDVEGARRPVLRDISFAIRPGEAVGLVGESGSGKSMTARAIGRLLPRAAEVHGSIGFSGSDTGSLSGAALRRYRGQVAMIFQDPRAHINPLRRIGDFMTEALRTNLGVPAEQARRREADALAQVGIEDGAQRLRQYPHQMSGGILQRIMIAAALLTEPRLLLADEPTTARSVASLHRRIGRGPPGHRPDGASAARHPRPAAVRLRGTAVRVRVRPPVPARPRHLPGGRPRPGRAGRRAIPLRSRWPACARSSAVSWPSTTSRSSSRRAGPSP